MRPPYSWRTAPAAQGGAATTFYTGPYTSYSNSIFYNGQLCFHLKACNASGCSAWGGYSYITLNSQLVLVTSPTTSYLIAAQGGEQ